MSSSSRSNSSTSTHSSASTTTPSSSTPSLAKLEGHLTSLITLARETLHPARHRPSPFLAAEKLLRIQDQLKVFFAKYPDCDWFTRGYHKNVLEMQTLMRMVESALGLSHGCVGWPDFSGRGEEEEVRAMQKGVYEEVEGLVFGGEVEGERARRDSGVEKVESGG